MLTDKSSDTLQRKNNKALLLELNPKALAPKLEKVFPKRIIKLQENSSSRKARTIKLLQSLELLQLQKNQANFQSTQNIDNNKNKISSYLIYKRQQQSLRANHNAKLFHLKSKFLECKPAAKRSIEGSSQSHSSAKSQLKLSNSKINLIVIGMNETQDNYCKPKTRSREFYIKTSEGKKRKLNTLEYQNQLRTKLQNQSKVMNKQLFQTFHEYSQSTFVSTLDLTPHNLKRQSSNMIRRRFNIKRKANSLSSFNHERLGQFRPWTSKKSQFGQ